jgi:cobyrinic acid a,c-diamide synthase
MQPTRHCSALVISAPASHQGKTSVTAALARYHRNRGRNVRVFKAGPDFLDPTILEQASGNAVYTLDLWMVGEQTCRRLLYEAAESADLILIEGVMGLFDGTPSTADLAKTLGMPVLLVINAAAMAQTFAAVATGLMHFDPEVQFYGVLANQVASERHEAMLLEGMPATVRYRGKLVKTESMSVKSRHLGLVQAIEIEDLNTRLDHAAELIGATSATDMPPPVAFAAQDVEPVATPLKDVRIAIARDAAFSFLYQANLDALREMGAAVSFFSPLKDETLPEADALYLPGGYPELYLQQLANNRSMKAVLRQFLSQGKRIYAECGGMLFLLESLTDQEGRQAEMAGLLPGHAKLGRKISGLGHQELTLPSGCLRGHTFHYSTADIPLAPVAYAKKRFGNGPGEAVFQHGTVTASYLHLYFPSHLQAAAGLFLP